MASAAPPVPAGPAHVATVSFLASRAAPTGGFWIALAGGAALARVAQRLGARQGYGASLAAMLETVAIMGPARFGVPLTQAVTAPMLGCLEARSVRFLLQVLACGAFRLLHNTATTAFFIWIVTGGLDAYAGTYDAIGRRLGIEVGTAEALVLTGASLLCWAAFASTVQVAVYRRGLRAWKEPEEGGAGGAEEPGTAAPGGADARRSVAAQAPAAVGAEAPSNAAAGPAGGSGVAPGGRAHRGRFDPRLVTAAAAVAFALLLFSTAWPVLAGVAVWLALAWAVSRPDPAPVPTGLVLTGLLVLGALAFSLGGGLGADEAMRRASRAGLLVLVATWLRAAAGAQGLREVSRRGLGRLRRLPSLPEAARTLERIGSEGRLLAAGRSLVDSLSGVPKRPLAVVDAVLAWVRRESRRFSPGAAAPVPPLRARPADWALLALAAAPAVGLPLA
jgi:hypothetical protein